MRSQEWLRHALNTTPFSNPSVDQTVKDQFLQANVNVENNKGRFQVLLAPVSEAKGSTVARSERCERLSGVEKCEQLNKGVRIERGWIVVRDARWDENHDESRERVHPSISLSYTHTHTHTWNTGAGARFFGHLPAESNSGCFACLSPFVKRAYKTQAACPWPLNTSSFISVSTFAFRLLQERL